MKTDLKKYIKVYSDCFDKEMLKETIKELESLPTKKPSLNHNGKTNFWEEHRWYSPINKKEHSRLKKELQSSGHTVKENQYYMDVIYEHIKKYMIDLNNTYLTSWDGFSMLTWHRYKKGTNMDLHTDNIKTVFDGTRKGCPVLSIVGQLNDNFLGGEFEILDQQIKMKAGDILIFPSNFLFPHQVKTITKGKRLSFVSWVW